MTPDNELLQQYVKTRSNDAFAELVRRHLNLVYSAALRQVNGDAHLAQDVAQTVFTDLARKAHSLSRHSTLSGWFYTSTYFAATKMIRTEQRRHAREQEAATMSEHLHDNAVEPDWIKLRSVLDKLMHELKDSDRDAILLRYFENRPLAEVAVRFGLSENAARMRIERAMEKLRAQLAKHGITTTATLSAVLTAGAVHAAPAGLATTLATASLATAGTGLTLLQIMTATKIKFALGAILVAGIATTLLLQHATQTRLYEQARALTLELEGLRTTNETFAHNLAHARQFSDEQLIEAMQLRNQLQLLEQKNQELEALRAQSQANRSRPRTNQQPGSYQGAMNLQNADIFSVAQILSALTQKPVAVTRTRNLPLINFETRETMSKDDAVDRFARSLLQQGVAIMDLDGKALKLVNTYQTNYPINLLRIEIDVRADAIFMGDREVTVNDLLQIINTRGGPEQEIWIHDSNPQPMVRSQKYTPSATPPDQIYELLLHAKVGRERIFNVYYPSRTILRD